MLDAAHHLIYLCVFKSKTFFCTRVRKTEAAFNFTAQILFRARFAEHSGCISNGRLFRASRFSSKSEVFLRCLAVEAVKIEVFIVVIFQRTLLVCVYDWHYTDLVIKRRSHFCTTFLFFIVTLGCTVLYWWVVVWLVNVLEVKWIFSLCHLEPYHWSPCKETSHLHDLALGFQNLIQPSFEVVWVSCDTGPCLEAFKL